MMDTSIIPIPFYTPLFYIAMLFIVLLTFLKLQIKGYTINTHKKEYASFVLLIVVTLYMGLRPISYSFGDMGNYNAQFLRYASGGEIIGTKDIFWRLFMKFCSGIMTAKTFFLVCAVLYIVPLYIATKNWLGKGKYLLFLMLIASFSFWPYGVNGIRNGIATSIFILGLSFSNKRNLQFVFIAMSFFIHGGLIIPISAFILSRLYKNSKHYLLGWLVSIPLSIILGGFWEKFFMSLGFGDERIEYFASEPLLDTLVSTGFRWDFLIYSASAVFAGYYFIIKKQFKDKVYIQLFNIYVTANAFWILVIRASFSNRFAYLSWFLMAAVIFYPFFKAKFFKNQQKILAYVVLGYFVFTYLMFLII